MYKGSLSDTPCGTHNGEGFDGDGTQRSQGSPGGTSHPTYAFIWPAKSLKAVSVTFLTKKAPTNDLLSIYLQSRATTMSQSTENVFNLILKIFSFGCLSGQSFNTCTVIHYDRICYYLILEKHEA